MALVIKQRGLATQSYGVQNAGAPGDLGAIDFGSATRRPGGPALAGWPMGWGAHNSNANFRHIWTIAAASGQDTKGMIWAWFRFGRGTGSGNNMVTVLNATNNFGGGAGLMLLRINVVTMDLELLWQNLGVTVNGVKTVARNIDVALGLAWEKQGNGTYIIKLLYQEAGKAIETIYTSGQINTGGADFISAGGGALWDNGAVIYMRYGLPSLYSMASMADATTPADITPPAFPDWYVSSSAAGGGTGVSLAQAFTPAELVSETATASYTIPSGNVINPVDGAVIDSTALDADVLRSRYAAGTALPSGPIIYFDDTAGPVRFALPLILDSCDAVRCLPLPSLGRPVEIRGTTRIAPGAWSLHAGNVYKTTLANSFGVAFELDSVAEANSPIGKPRWLAHPTAADLATYLAAATAGSFWTDGTAVYLWPTGSGNPASNGKVYEVTTGNDLMTMQGTGGLAKDLIIRYSAAVSNDNSGGSAAAGYTLRIKGSGMMVCDNLDIAFGGKHGGPAIIRDPAGPAVTSAKLRGIFVNIRTNDCRPTSYGGVGGQSVLVNYGVNDALDNQWYYDNVQITTNTGVVGSTVGTIDVLNASILEHNNGDAAYPFSKGWMANCSIPGLIDLGGVTTTATIDRNDLSSLGSVIQIRSKNTTITRNIIRTLGLPYLGNGFAPGPGAHAVRANKIISSGGIGVVPTWIGTVTFVGNTVDALNTTSGVGSLATRSGVLAITFAGNVVLFNNSQSYRLFGTITPASGDSLAMAQNAFEASDPSRILIDSYGGATKTLAQLQAGGQDTGSQFAASDGLNSTTYAPSSSSIVRNLVDLATVPTLALTLDFAGRTRPASPGKTDAGALLFAANNSSFARTRPGRSPRLARV